MLRPKIRKGCKSWARKGKGLCYILLGLLIGIEITPQENILYVKKMVIWIVDG